MNRTALSVIGLAVGAVLIIGLFNIYKPAVSHVAHDVFSKVKIGHMGTPKKTGTYDGLKFNDWGNGEIEFTGGTLTSNQYGSFFGQGNTPNDILNASSITFGDGVSTKNLTSLNGKFSGAPNLKSIDFGDGFNTSKVRGDNQNWGMQSAFENDSKLTSIHFGKGFTVPNGTDLQDMFMNDGNINLTGNVPSNVNNVYQNRNKNSSHHYPRNY